MAEQAVQTTYYSKTGQENTQRTLELARDRARQLGIDTILVASSSGATGVLAAQLLQGFHTIIVSHSTGFAGPNTQELLPIHRVQIEAAGVPILTCQHTFGGVTAPCAANWKPTSWMRLLPIRCAFLARG